MAITAIIMFNRILTSAAVWTVRRRRRRLGKALMTTCDDEEG